MNATALADLIGGLAEHGDDRDFHRLAPVHSAGPDELTWIGDATRLELLASTRAGCVLIPRDMPNPTGRSVLRVDDPRRAFGRLALHLQPRPPRATGVHASAIIDPTATLGQRVTIGPLCVVGAGCVLGDDIVLEARVTLYDGVRLGARCVVHAGCVLGADGFGYQPTPHGLEKVPQLGGLEIGADVEIGANTTIDRGTLDPTRIGDGCKLDNLVHIAHNCRLGAHVVIAAQTGLAGGAVVEDGAVLGGQVGVGDKVHIGRGAQIGAASAIPTGKHIPAGQAVWGVPARPLRSQLRALAGLNRLEALREQVETLSRSLAELRPAKRATKATARLARVRAHGSQTARATSSASG